MGRIGDAIWRFYFQWRSLIGSGQLGLIRRANEPVNRPAEILSDYLVSFILSSSSSSSSSFSSFSASNSWMGRRRWALRRWIYRDRLEDRRGCPSWRGFDWFRSDSIKSVEGRTQNCDGSNWTHLPRSGNSNTAPVRLNSKTNEMVDNNVNRLIETSYCASFLIYLAHFFLLVFVVVKLYDGRGKRGAGVSGAERKKERGRERGGRRSRPVHKSLPNSQLIWYVAKRFTDSICHLQRSRYRNTVMLIIIQSFPIHVNTPSGR